LVEKHAGLHQMKPTITNPISPPMAPGSHSVQNATAAASSLFPLSAGPSGVSPQPAVLRASRQTAAGFLIGSEIRRANTISGKHSSFPPPAASLVRSLPSWQVRRMPSGLPIASTFSSSGHPLAFSLKKISLDFYVQALDGGDPVPTGL